MLLPFKNCYHEKCVRHEGRKLNYHPVTGSTDETDGGWRKDDDGKLNEPC